MHTTSYGSRPAITLALLLGSTMLGAADPEDGGLPGADTPTPDIEAGREKSHICIACHGEEGVSQQDNYPHLHGQQETYLLRQMRTFRDGGDRRDPIMTPMLENMTDQDLVNLAAYYASFANILGSTDEAEKKDKTAFATPALSAEAKAEAKEKIAAASGEPLSAAEPPSTDMSASAETVPSPAPSVAAPATPAAGSTEAGKTKSAACAACHGVDGRGTTPLFPNLNGQKPEYLAVQLKAFREGKRTDPTMAPMAMALTDQDIADLAAFYGSLK